jgi:hypothetical protein
MYILLVFKETFSWHSPHSNIWNNIALFETICVFKEELIYMRNVTWRFLRQEVMKVI